MIRRDLELEDWGSVPFTLVTREELSPDQKNDLVMLVNTWYDDGARSMFGGVLHYLEPVGFDRLPDGKLTAEWVVDMGTAEEIAVDDLTSRLSDFATAHRLIEPEFIVGVIDIP
jgi:hypothetical protein